MKTTQNQIDQLSKSMMDHPICGRAMLMYTLLTGYSLFDSIQIKKDCTKTDITYKDAEFIADKFEEVTGINIAPTNLLFDKNQLADDLLDDYQEYQFLLNSYDENTRSMVISFYHHLFYNRRVPHDTVQILLNALSAFIQYACGSINKKNLKKQIIDIDLQKMKIVPVDSMYVRHNFIYIEKDFNDICLKKANRILKQAGEEPLSKYSIDVSI
ncbi:hypothetical protein H8788_15870 [Parabacteroides faecis]|uniref:Uncharacterized protein n=2 Tax=Parabacteroides faecis TaxID=1217282 RepID=A0ABR6KUL8_9BACT|nr:MULTISPECIES: hypothetical protein [Parabacteroides]MBB4625121.1 hypothetical protein [Parabacteroides faecis]MBC8619223.1 hypothetical protein [Parabacteroides faecis]RHR99986.1 hypothetical protein DWW23_04885 [Parabacteroides sp. AF14-59]